MLRHRTGFHGNRGCGVRRRSYGIERDFVAYRKQLQSRPRRGRIRDGRACCPVHCAVFSHSASPRRRAPRPHTLPTMISRPDVLVLGGGGVIGERWMMGVLAGIEDATGFDLRQCEHFVGTRAGSIVAARLAAGKTLNRPTATGTEVGPPVAAPPVPRASAARRAGEWTLAAWSPLAPLALAVAGPRRSATARSGAVADAQADRDARSARGVCRGPGRSFRWPAPRRHGRSPPRAARRVRLARRSVCDGRARRSGVVRGAVAVRAGDDRR